MDKLTLLMKPAAPHVVFGLFNLTWPGITMWSLLIIFFAISIWCRIPEFMEADASSREGGVEE